MTALLHASEETTCPIVNAPDDYHFEMRCEDCDVKSLSRSTLGDVQERYHAGRITQDEYEAYCYVWALLSPTGSLPEWRAVPEIPAVRRIARKLLRARGLEVPSELAVEQGRKATDAVAQVFADWNAARHALVELERAEHPDITDRFGRVWTWISGDLYRHDDTLAFPKALIERISLPSPQLADNPNYARLCSTCRSGWSS